jgi:hypothetical protein
VQALALLRFERTFGRSWTERDVALVRVDDAKVAEIADGENEARDLLRRLEVFHRREVSRGVAGRGPARAFLIGWLLQLAGPRPRAAGIWRPQSNARRSRRDDGRAALVLKLDKYVNPFTRPLHRKLTAAEYAVIAALAGNVEPKRTETAAKTLRRPPRPKVLDDDRRQQLRALVDEHGCTAVARTVQLGREQIARLCAGIEAGAGTVAIAVDALDRIASQATAFAPTPPPRIIMREPVLPGERAFSMKDRR